MDTKMTSRGEPTCLSKGFVRSRQPSYGTRTSWAGHYSVGGFLRQIRRCFLIGRPHLFAFVGGKIRAALSTMLLRRLSLSGRQKGVLLSTFKGRAAEGRRQIDAAECFRRAKSYTPCGALRGREKDYFTWVASSHRIAARSSSTREVTPNFSFARAQ